MDGGRDVTEYMQWQSSLISSAIVELVSDRLQQRERNHATADISNRCLHSPCSSLLR